MVLPIAQREVNRWLRELIQARANSLSLDATRPNNPNADPDDPPALWERAQRLDKSTQTAHDAKLDIRRLGRDLPPEQAKVVSLVAEGYSLAQIAELTGAPVGTTRSRYNLAKRKMAGRAKKTPRSK